MNCLNFGSQVPLLFYLSIDPCALQRWLYTTKSDVENWLDLSIYWPSTVKLFASIQFKTTESLPVHLPPFVIFIKFQEFCIISHNNINYLVIRNINGRLEKIVVEKTTGEKRRVNNGTEEKRWEQRRRGNNGEERSESWQLSVCWNGSPNFAWCNCNICWHNSYKIGKV